MSGKLSRHDVAEKAARTPGEPELCCHLTTIEEKRQVLAKKEGRTGGI